MARLSSPGHRYVLTTDAVIARRDQRGFRAVFGRYIAYGRCGPVLYRRFRETVSGRTYHFALKTWAWLVVDATTRAACVSRPMGRIAGWRTGRLCRVGATESALPLRSP